MGGSTHDVMVVGGGHNGLVAANCLADAGLDVCVVEVNSAVGGVHRHSRGYTRGARPHLINSFSVDAFFWDAFPPSYELNLERYGLRRVEVDPGHVYVHPDGGSIEF
jgi:phytoene dehydrogenase-like protein